MEESPIDCQTCNLWRRFYDPEPDYPRSVLRAWSLFVGLRLPVVEKSLDLQRAVFRRAGVDPDSEGEIALALTLIQVFEQAIAEREKGEQGKTTVDVEK